LNPPHRPSPAAGAFLAAILAAGCGESVPDEPQAPDSPYPPTAHAEIHEQFLADLAAERSPSDGGGAARLLLDEGEDGSATATGRGEWKFEYRAGPQGIAVGGSLQFLISPYWGWSPPQPFSRDREGYTEIECQAEGVELVPTLDRSLLILHVEGRELREGETILLHYGAGPAQAAADIYAERESRFWFKVDGDGDGVAGLVADPPAVEVHPGPATRLTATLASAARPGGKVRLSLAALDGMANAWPRIEGVILLKSEPAGLPLPESVEMTEGDRGCVELELTAEKPGIFRVRADLEIGDETVSALSNPLRIAAGISPLFWGDLHGHSNYSDGTGLPEDYFRYARDVASLDLIVLTDHDHFGIPFLDAAPELWEEIREEVRSVHQPGRFVALLGFEWTSWLYGHRHVVYFDGEGDVLSSVGAETTTPRELWDALQGREALTFAHHSAGGPVAVDWSFVPDPSIEPVTEVSSVHGSSEAWDSPSRIRGAIPGNSVRDQLDRGLVFGFVGSGDSHDGHPGHAHLTPSAGYRRARPDLRGENRGERMGNGGLAAIRAPELTPAALLESLRSRRVYATSGPRIWLATSLAGRTMGSTIPLAELGENPVLVAEVAGTAGIEYVDVIRKGRPIERRLAGGRMDLQLEEALDGLSAGDYVYLRVVQEDGGLAWSSPFYVE
jgi:hypothetical protein